MHDTMPAGAGGGGVASRLWGVADSGRQRQHTRASTGSKRAGLCWQAAPAAGLAAAARHAWQAVLPLLVCCHLLAVPARMAHGQGMRRGGGRTLSTASTACPQLPKPASQQASQPANLACLPRPPAGPLHTEATDLLVEAAVEGGAVQAEGQAVSWRHLIQVVVGSVCAPQLACRRGRRSRPQQHTSAGS